MAEYFGKGCKWFSGQWERGDDEIEDYKDKIIPVLVFCNHPGNPEDNEGNCNCVSCPLKKKDSDFYGLVK